MKDNLKIWKKEYLSNHLLDRTQILNLTKLTKLTCTNLFNEDDLQWKTTPKY